MDEVTVSLATARVVVWLDRQYSTREEMLDAAIRALRVTIIRDEEDEKWDPF